MAIKETILELLVRLHEENGSDLHVSVGAKPSCRVFGEIKQFDDFPVLTSEDTRTLAYSMIREEQRKKFENEKELDFGYEQEGLGRFRCNFFFQRESVAFAIRALPLRIPTMEEILLPEIIKKKIFEPRGLVLVTGPTGSGKTTSLAAMLNHINEVTHKHVVTLEDPIEFSHQHKNSIVNQREIGVDSFSFAESMKRVLRQDPDIILVGEMRDLETIAAAITAAETGHLVFATIHTINAPMSIDRIIDVFPAEQQEMVRAQLANCIQVIMSQTLLKRSDRPGRLAAFEMMVGIPAVRNLIREGKIYQIPSTMMTHKKEGMQTMDQCLRDYYFANLITLETAMSRCHNPKELRNLIAAKEAELQEASGEESDSDNEPTAEFIPQ
tara:strand:- start:528 stop:1676 length:1149 start_codon:yes stop_codon:yes gene_type:complete